MQHPKKGSGFLMSVCDWIYPLEIFTALQIENATNGNRGIKELTTGTERSRLVICLRFSFFYLRE